MAKLRPEGADACMEAGAPLMAVIAIMSNMEDVNVCINASDLIRKLVESSDTNKQIIKDMKLGQLPITLAIMFARITHEGRETTSQRDEEDKVYVLDRLDALLDVLSDDELEDDDEEEEGEDPRKHPNGNPEGPNNEGGGRRRRKRATQKKKKTKRRHTRRGLKYV